MAPSEPDPCGASSATAETSPTEDALLTVKIGPCGNCGRSIDHEQAAGGYPCKTHGGWRG